MSPFEVELQGAEIEFYVNGANTKAQHILRQKYAAGSVSTWRIEGTVDPVDADRIVKNMEKEKARISLEADFSCTLHDFKKGPLSLDGVSVEYSNYEWRKNKMKSSA